MQKMLWRGSLWCELSQEVDGYGWEDSLRMSAWERRDNMEDERLSDKTWWALQLLSIKETTGRPSALSPPLLSLIVYTQARFYQLMTTKAVRFFLGICFRSLIVGHLQRQSRSTVAKLKVEDGSMFHTCLLMYF